MKLYLTKQGNGSFMPSYGSDHEAAKKIKTGNTVECEIKQSRNILFHRKFFALINLCFENQELFKHFEELRKALIIDAGYYKEFRSLDGTKLKEAESISFAKMDELEFGELYSKVVDSIVKHFGIDKQELMDNIEMYF